MFKGSVFLLLAAASLTAFLQSTGFVAPEARAAERQIAESNDEALAFIDSYLERWDRFAQGETDLVPELNAGLEPFAQRLSLLLDAEDPRAPARAVFFTTVQVAGEIPLETPLGQSMQRVMGDEVPVMRLEGRPPSYAAWHLFQWWTDNRERFEAFPLLDAWAQRDLTKQTVLPMYEQLLASQ